MTVLLFVMGLVAIVGGCELFTNAVEWLGFRLKLASGATGSLLAAVGTSLPETIVPVVALIRATPNADSIAIGSVLGSSFLLLTLGAAVTGLAVLSRRHQRELVVDRGQVRRDLTCFVTAFSVALLCTVLPTAVRPFVGVGLLVGYGLYVRATLASGEPNETLPEPLHLVRQRPGEPHTGLVLVQLAVATVLLIVGSTFFVEGLTNVAATFHLNPLVLAVVAVPVATELPETLNSVLWVRSNDDGLAFGNIAGSASFQACILGWLGVTFTSWKPGAGGFLSAVCALATALYLVVLLRDGRTHGRWLVLAALPWLAYVAVEMAAGGRLA